MSGKQGPGSETHDDDLLADLFDTFLQEILEGRTPELSAALPERPDLLERVQQTWSLACSVAGRREPSRPVLGGYEILHELGHGGMGTVYLARHEALERKVAIKVLPHSLAMSGRAKERFLEEARSLARLRHQNVVHIHRIIDHSEMLAFEMEYVDGPSLRSLIRDLAQRDKPQALTTLAECLRLPAESLEARNSVEWFVRLGIRIARALAEVHRHGLVHRDVKPSNILLRANGQPVLADFGLARAEDLLATQTGFAGTPVYAAPERLRDGDADLDARADVYSLGVTLYEALTLMTPFAGTTTHEVLRRIEEGRLPSLRSKAPHVSRDLETVLGKAMEPDRRRRYATADEFADDLERLLALQPILARPAGPFRRALKFLRRHQKLAMASAAGAMLVAGTAWPFAAHAKAMDEARSRAAASLLAARSRLLCPENLHRSWATGHRDAGRQELHMPEATQAQLGQLDQALECYRGAIDATPDDRQLRLEHAAVHAFASLLRGDGTDSHDEERLPPLLGTLVHRAQNREPLAEGLARLVDDAAIGDRFAAGLFAFLQHDAAASQQCWSGLAVDLPDHGFLDACQAVEIAAEGNLELAYPRLFHAARAFPDASGLVFALADAAVACGDLDLAEQWCATIPDIAATQFADARRLRLQADMLAARGKVEEASQRYRALASRDPSDPEPIQRLTTLALRSGQTDVGQRMLNELIRRWPDLTLPRLQLARLALQRRDLPGYLEQARFVLRQDSNKHTRGTARQLQAILRIAGFDRLADEQVPAEIRAVGANSLEATPLSVWLGQARVTAIEQALRVLAVHDRATDDVAKWDSRPFAIMLNATWATLLQLPSLGSLLPRHWHPTALVAIPAFGGPTVSALSPMLLPYQQILGSRVHMSQANHLITQPTTNRSMMFGHQVRRAGDVDGDALPDLCIACPPIGNLGEGCVEIRNVADGSLVRTFDSGEGTSCFGQAIAVMPDVDGDHCNDLLVGAPTRNKLTPSFVRLVSGRTGMEIWTVEDAAICFGAAIAAGDDFDGDGTVDVVVGAAPDSLQDDQRGRALVFSGRYGSLLAELVAERSGVWFGGAVANAGDCNGDGVADILVGGNFGNAPGLVSLFDGKTRALLGSFSDDNTAVDFGRTVTGIADADGDGRADIAIAAPAFSSRGSTAGSVHVLGSRTWKQVYELRGDQPRDGFGNVLCALPSWRSNGRPAVAVAARRGGPAGCGYVRVFAATNGAPIQTLTGSVANFGYELVDLGDATGDGYRDLGIMVMQRSGICSLMQMSIANLPANQR